MDGLKRAIRWAFLLWKRLYKKLTFLLLLAVIPVMVLCYGAASQEESGLATIALATEGETVETLTRTVWDELKQSNVILFIECDSADEAAQMVQEGRADTAWVFAEDLEEKVYEFVAFRSRKNAFVTVLEPENRVGLMLVREVLSGVLFPHCSETLYLNYIRENVPELDGETDEQLLEYYRNTQFSEGLFVFTDLEGNVTAESEDNYLLTPLRGMLAVVIMFAGLATSMYYIRDNESGTFAWIPQRRLLAVELGCQLISVVNVTLVVLLSLALSKQTVNLGREVLIGAIYSLCVAAFAMLVRRLTGGIRGLSMITPLLVVVMLAVCPVFFDLGGLRAFQQLLPPTYFINAAYNDRYLITMPAYAIAALLLCGIVDRCKKIR